MACMYSLRRPPCTTSLYIAVATGLKPFWQPRAPARACASLRCHLVPFISVEPRASDKAAVAPGRAGFEHSKTVRGWTRLCAATDNVVAKRDADKRRSQGDRWARCARDAKSTSISTLTSRASPPWTTRTTRTYWRAGDAWYAGHDAWATPAASGHFWAITSER